MYIIVDIVLAAVFAVCLIVGWKRGFIDSALRLLSWVIAFFVAFFVTPRVAPYVNEHVFYGKISSYTEHMLEGMENGGGAEKLFGEGDENSAFREFIEKFGADYDQIKQTAVEKSSEGAHTLVEGITEKIAAPVSYAISYALCFILIFIVSMLLLWLIRHLLDLAAKLPVIKTANKILGLILGGLMGILFVWVLSALLKLGLPYLTIMAPKVFPEDLFERSIILNLTYYLNALRGALDFNNIIKALK